VGLEAITVRLLFNPHNVLSINPNPDFKPIMA